jgi:UDP-N-acetylglucosamine 2-epimerase (non-hydrolysing)
LTEKVVARAPTVLAIFGTRPEAIKLAPVVRALAAEPDLAVRVAVTGQHRELLDQVLAVFGIAPDHDLAVMVAGQSLPELTGRLLPRLDRVIASEAPAAVLVQGDTTTALVAALAAFYRRVPVGHVEAGLRTNDRHAPFPEEINRRLVSVLTTWHFAPTPGARDALLGEGIAAANVLVTGNTVIDALRHVLATTEPPLGTLPAPGRRLLLVTAHRRESFGPPLESLCRAIRRIADRHPDLEVCYPVHPNPNVREPVHRILGAHPRVQLLEPLDYVAFAHLLARADIVLTDSGGIQEEGPALGKPVLVARDVTERPEAVAAGVAELVGTDEERIVTRVGRLLDDPAAYAAMARAVSPYGDGRAGERIVGFLRARLVGGF